jgi:peptide/nickel transport system substrate-binding protein
MQPWRSTAIGLVTLAVAVLGCAPQAQPGVRGGREVTEPQVQRGPKRIVAAIRGDPHTVYQKLNPRSNIPGIDDLERLVTAGLTTVDTDATLLPWLAEAVPTIENGLWKVFPDGRMELTFTIRPGVTWQDGRPFTAEDLVFTARMVQDRDLPIFGHIAWRSLEDVEDVDGRTVIVRWRRPFIEADAMFSYGLAVPVARHLLEPAYLEDKERFIDHPSWSTEYVGTGPFKLKEWQRGSHLVLEANERFFRGRPKLDEIRVKFIPDPSTLAANILAGEVELTLGGRISTEWAMGFRDQWKDGRVEVTYRSMLQIYPQFINPTPPIVGNLQFRRAMLHALDRQQMVDVLQYGLTSIGHTFLSPMEPEYRFIESSIVKYDYDQKRAAQLIEELGYARGPDGGYRDRAGQRLSVQTRTSQGDELQEKTMYAAGDDWRRLGVDIEVHLVVPQRAADAEYRSTFPAFDVKRQAGTMAYATSFHSSRVALPENNFLVSGNNARYRNAELDALIDRYFTTIPMAPRMEAAGQVVRHVSDQVAWMGMFYQTEPIVFAHRIQNVQIPKASSSTILWNVHEWDLR